MADIGFIGVGNMGGPMATNLVKAGHDVKVFDLVDEAVDKVVQEGARRASSAAKAATDCEVLISMLPASEHVEMLYLGERGLLQNIAAETLVIDCSTIAPATSRSVADEARPAGIAFLDAPVSGGVGGAV
ncbi:MAG: NAD(P)-binding domain-containing protein, partial [Pseudomonadales bacterium]|nr:NAD(P)-binding domain-containing protein [Pseudomonadales bacterium]